MKYSWLLLLLLPFTFMSCMDTREELEIKSNGSGTLTMRSDLSKMLEMVKGFAPEGELSKDGLDKAVDTVVLMKDFIDTAKDVTAEQKELLRNGKMHVVMNMKESIGKFDMNFPFTSIDKIQLLYANLNNSSGALKKLFDGVGKKLPNANPGDQGNEKDFSQITSVYDINVKNGLYSRKVNKERYDAFALRMKPEEFKQLGAMLGAMDYTLALKLPRPIKKISNTKATLSDDKKTVTLNADLIELMQHPELLSLDIEY